jgi:parvulin-like peptidyl-prolyl isomerase
MVSSLRKLSPLLLLALAAALVLAACGSSGEQKTVPPGAIALVGDHAIPKSDLDQLLEQTKKNYEAQKQDFPQAGTPAYEDLKSTLVKSLVQQAQVEQAGAAMGIKVTDQEVETKLDALKQQYFKGDEAAFEDELKKQELTVAQVRDEIRGKLLSDKIYNAVIGKVQVTDAEISAYYDKHKADYQQTESREVRHILVKKKSLADRIYNELKNGADFAKLAQKYSQDPASKDQGGKFTAYKGKTVAPFDKFVFSADTGDLSKPIKTDFGWHVIEVLSDIKPPGVQPLADVRDSISSTLLQQKQNEALRNFVQNARDKYPATYAPGYAPAPTTTEGGAATTTG